MIVWVSEDEVGAGDGRGDEGGNADAMVRVQQGVF